jgi:hypothetical protein
MVVSYGVLGLAAFSPILERFLDDSESILREAANWAVRKINERLNII